MTSSQAEKRLQKHLCPLLQSLGFSEDTRLFFFRPQEDRSEILKFGGRMDRGTFRFNCVVGVRFPSVEAFLRPSESSPTYPTISAPIHFLHPDRKYVEWEFRAEDDIAPVINAVHADILDSASKFFSHYSSLAVVEQDLRQGAAGARWHTLALHQITALLAAIAILDGRAREAQKIVECALADPRNSPPAKRRRLVELKARIQIASQVASVPGETKLTK